MAEFHGFGIAAVFAANTKLDVRTRLATERNAELHHRADAFLVDRRKRIALHDFQARVITEERAGVVAAHAERGLRQVVRSEGEKFRIFGNLVRRRASARNFNHRADLVRNFHLLFRHDFGGDAANDCRLIFKFRRKTDERDHHFRSNANFFLNAICRRFKNRARLHFRNFRIGNSEAATAMPEHRIELMKLGYATLNVFDGNAEFFRKVKLLLFRLRKKFVQRRVEQANRCRQAFQLTENAFKVAALIREQLVDGGATPFQIRRENHFAHGVDTIAFEEHVFRAGKPDALRAESNRDSRLRRCVRVRAHAEARYLFTPRHQLSEIFVSGGFFRLFVPANDTENDVARSRGDLPEINISGRAVDTHPFAFLDGNVADGKRAVRVVDIDCRRAADANLTHLAGNKCRVRGNASARRQNPFRRNHAAQIFRRGFEANEQNFFAVGGSRFRALRIEINFSGSSARSGGKPVRDRRCALECLAVKHGSQNLVELIGGNAAHRRFPVDELFANHFAGNTNRRHARALAVAGLKHENLGIFNRKFKVLHVAEVIFQRFANAEQLLVRGRHYTRKMRDGIGRAHARNHVFALRIHQKFAVENFFSARRVARERHAGAGLVARVPENHGLNIDRRAPAGRNVIFLAVNNRTLIHPRAENRTDCAFKLLPRIRREITSRAVFD